MQQPSVGMGHDIRIEVDVDLGCAQHGGVNHRSKVTLAVKVVRGERTGGHMTRIAGDRMHCIQVERLPVENVSDETFAEQIDQVLG